MQGTNSWNVYETTNQPQFFFKIQGLFSEFRYVYGALRWAKIERGSSTYTGWVLCYPDGKPITYADNNQPGSISVSASGTYMTL